MLSESEQWWYDMHSDMRPDYRNGDLAPLLLIFSRRAPATINICRGGTGYETD
jgi:hypothetical protein